MSFTSLLPNFFPTDDGIVKFTIIVQSINSAIFFLSILLFFNYFSGKDSNLRLITVSGALSSILILQIAAYIKDTPELVGTMYDYQETLIADWSGLVRIILLPVILLTGIWSYTDIKKSRENILTRDQIPQLNRMKYGFLLLFGSAIVLNIIANGSGNNALYVWLIHIVLLGVIVPVSITLISLAYLRTNKVAFMQPVQIDTILVIHKIGTPLYQHDFVQSALKTDMALASGAIKAISAIMEDAFGVSSDIKTIEFQDKELLLEFGNKIAFVLITEEESAFLRNSLVRFKDLFIKEYQESIENETGDISPYEDSEYLVKQAFGI